LHFTWRTLFRKLQAWLCLRWLGVSVSNLNDRHAPYRTRSSFNLSEKIWRQGKWNDRLVEEIDHYHYSSLIVS
jgi:hypothetical protein